ncbi:serrate RNA effector molecule isoform X4 [Helianthus annuus]|uniref:serrate RNA effector molecule isoform X4 n=1 Tax=Helianthus annuus TaxID=4232 RepID=UPI001652B889|nr:serrate RNA effector molecule isoform X4 [Helianthus annuus]
MFYLFIFFVKFLFCVKSYKHLSAFVNWESARGGYNDQVNTLREGLMSYKQFIQELEDGVLPSEAERRYQEYKSQYISTQNWMALLMFLIKANIQNPKSLTIEVDSGSNFTHNTGTESSEP